MKLGTAIKKFRRIKNLRQKELAGKLGISVKHLACVELGLSDASSTVRRKICEVTGIVENYEYPQKNKRGYNKRSAFRRRRSTRK